MSQMDSRCPRKLVDLPKEPCEDALVRLKALRAAGDSPTHQEEAALPGCPWYLNDKESHYCFWNYNDRNAERQADTIEIAQKLGITQASVYSTLNRALEKMRKSEVLKGVGSNDEPEFQGEAEKYDAGLFEEEYPE